MGLILFVLWALICGYAFLSNRDIFSPVKLYFLALGVYFADIFIKEYSLEICLTYTLYLLMGLLLAMLEARFNRKISTIEKRSNLINNSLLVRITVIMWLLTLIPVAAQIYLFYLMGGVEQYLVKLGFRVLEWQGLGYVTTIIRLINVISIFYFGVGLVAKIKRPVLWWWLFSFHFTLFIAIGLLSGSRGFLEIIITMLIMYHYLRQRISVKTAVSLGLILFITASAIGVARNGFKVDDGQLITGFSKGGMSKFKLRQGDYGIQPLDLVYSQEVQELQLGKTFLTVFTNFVPRNLWPEKPDPGGLVLTKQFTGDAWGGASNLSTGMIAESILNFGYVGGVITGSLILFGSMLVNVKLYQVIKINSATCDPIKAMLIIVLYISFMKTVAGLVLAEFTNAFIPLFISCASFGVLYLIVKYKITIFNARTNLETGVYR